MKIPAWIAWVALLAACKNDVPSAPMEPAPASVTPAPEVPQHPTADKTGSATSVQIGSDGVSVETNGSQTKTDVSVKEGKAAVEVKTR